MGAIFRWMLRNPFRASILIGIVVAVVFGWVSFPRDRTIEKTVSGWLPDNVVGFGSARTELLDVLDSYNAGMRDDILTVSEDEFRDLGLAQAYAAPAVREDGGDFRIQYVGRMSAGTGEVYVAERTVSPAPWWSPDRLLYKAFEAETDQFANVLRLTYERDLSGLAGLFLMDAIVGGLYAIVVGMILSVLGMEGLDKAHKPKPLPGPSPIVPFSPGSIFRA